MNPSPEQPDAPFTMGNFTAFKTEWMLQVVHTTGEPPLAERFVFLIDSHPEKCHADAALTAKAFNAATALHAAGWDAARVFENMAEIMKCVEAYNEHTPYPEMGKFLAQLKLKRDTAGGGR